MFRLNIETGNAAFGEGDTQEMAEELARILRDVANRIEAGSPSGKVMDYNGNKVGRYSIEES